MNPNQSNFKNKAHKPLIIALVTFVIGASLLVDLREYINGIQALDWKKVESTLLARDIEAIKIGSSTVLKMKLKYQYVANGRIIFGHKLKFQEKPAFDGFEISNLEKKYKLGDKIVIYYNPSNPEQSCIEPGADFVDVVSHFLIYVIFAVIVYFSAYPRLYKFKSIEPDSKNLDSSLKENNAANTSD